MTRPGGCRKPFNREGSSLVSLLTASPLSSRAEIPSSNAAVSSRRLTIAISAITFLSMVPVTMLVAPLRVLISERFATGSFWTHSFMAFNTLGAIVAAPIIALLSDQAGSRKRIAMAALGVDAICLAAMALVPTFAGILAIRFVEGAAHILALSTLMAIAAGSAPEGRRGRVMGLVGTCMMFGTAAGTRLGGAVSERLGDGTFLAAGAIALIAALGVLAFVTEARRSTPSKARFRDGIALAKRHPQLLVPFAYGLIDRLCVGVVISTFVMFLGDIHRLGPEAISKVLVLFLAPFAILIYPVGRLLDRVGRVWPMALGSIAFGLVFASYGYLSRDQLTIAMLLSGLFSALMFAPNLVLCADLSPPANRGAAYAGFNLAGSLGFVLGPLLAGGLYAVLATYKPSLTAYRLTFVAAGATEVLCALITLPFLISLARRGIIR